MSYSITLPSWTAGENALEKVPEICAPYAQQMSQFLYSAIANRQTLSDLVGYNFYHPSAFEMLTEAFEDARKSFKLFEPI